MKCLAPDFCRTWNVWLPTFLEASKIKGFLWNGFTILSTSVQCTFELVIKGTLISRRILKLAGSIGVFARVARFFLLQHTKKEETIPNNQKRYQMAIEYTKWL
jgi:hypothetical protein